MRGQPELYNQLHLSVVREQTIIYGNGVSWLFGAKLAIGGEWLA